MNYFLNRKLTFLLMQAALLLPLGIFAANSTLVVELKNGKHAYFILSEKPILTPHGSMVKIESENVMASYERSDVMRMYFADESVGVDDIEKERNSIVFTQTEPYRLTISNLSEKDEIIVSNLAGRLYSGCVSRHGTDAIVDLGSCPKGVYIIKIGNKQTIKMTKK